jgi:transcriptional/translational regulatory protein YebC/TACO1
VLSFAPGAPEEKITDVAIEAGADDVVVHADDGSIEVLTSPESYQTIRDAMEKAGVKPDESEITMRADNDITLTGDSAQSVAKLLEWLEDLDDVQNVYSNADLPAEAFA